MRRNGFEENRSRCGVSALVKMARAGAVLRERNYVVPGSVQSVFRCLHRRLRPVLELDGITARDILAEILQRIKPQVRKVSGYVEKRNWPIGRLLTKCCCSIQ
ncbi:hypothetical protein [Hominenteromicrobium sp.]|uniref:hypothetical protein n=1 Tax=Hominenteromicrobium sp. TaxID=3073581 RepID=UPI00399C4735